ncbi:MAG: TadE/TadG family type IV pilus assembly protein, partial [Sphingomonadales bacterium]
MTLFRDQRGSVLLELAFAMPVMIMVVFGGVELTRFLINAQKINRVAMSTADLVSQSREITEADVNNMFVASQAVMGNSTLTDQGNVIISSVTRTGDDPPKVKWQRDASGNHSGQSDIGTPNGNANLPTDVVLDAGDGVSVVEVFYNHQPLLFDKVVGNQDIYQIAF